MAFLKVNSRNHALDVGDDVPMHYVLRRSKEGLRT